MKISIESKQTYHSIAELVEGEGFLHCDANANDSVWIYVGMDEDYENVNLLQVTHIGLISRVFSTEFVMEWQLQPLEITSIAFAPSTCRKHG